MKTLSKEAENKVIAAIKRAVALVDDDGLHPNAAMSKVAGEEKWGTEMIRFAAQAYNTGRQTAQREQATGALDKFASFPIVDPAAVIDAIYPAKPKTASDELPPDHTSTLPPLWIEARQVADRMRGFAAEKVASEAFKPSPEPGVDPVAAYNQHRNLKRAAVDARVDVMQANDDLLRVMNGLRDYFAKSAYDRLALSDVEFSVTTYHGESGKQLMDWVVDRVPQLRKEARYTPGQKMAKLVAYDETLEPYNLVAACIKRAKDLLVKRAAADKAAAAWRQHTRSELAPLLAVPTVKRSWDVLGGEQVEQIYEDDKLSGFLPPAEKTAAPVDVEPQPATQWSILTGSVGEASKAASFTHLLSGGIGGAMSKMLGTAISGGADATRMQANNLSDLEDPAHDAELRQIQVQAMLSDLMRNDDVIKGFEPGQVTAAYNKISQMAPRAAMQPLAMQTLLRRHLQGNVEPFETSELTALERGIKDTANPIPNRSIMPPAQNTNGNSSSIFG